MLERQALSEIANSLDSIENYLIIISAASLFFAFTYAYKVLLTAKE